MVTSRPGSVQPLGEGSDCTGILEHSSRRAFFHDVHLILQTVAKYWVALSAVSLYRIRLLLPPEVLSGEFLTALLTFSRAKT